MPKTLMTMTNFKIFYIPGRDSGSKNATNNSTSTRQNCNITLMLLFYFFNISYSLKMLSTFKNRLNPLQEGFVKLLKLVPQRLSSLLLPGIIRLVPVPNPLPLGITNGDDLIDDLE
jgi:hypothetical protein